MKTFLTHLICILLGVVIGIIVTVFLYPFIFPPAQVNEKITSVQQKIIIAQGAFRDHSPNDPIHWGKGGLKLYKGKHSRELYFESDFQVGPGPAFYVYLSESADITSNDDFKRAHSIQISPLKSFRGSQVYDIPKKLDLRKIKSVVIWCRSFGQLITSANLNVK